VPHGDLLIASDGEATSRSAPDHVPGVSLSSVTCESLTLRRPGVRTLDVGTGCGVQALVAAQHSDSVVATDVNPRALAYARFNALLNGFPNIETREGSLLEPVAEETFDLLVCNAPYVVSPALEYVFRDSGRRGDEVSESLVRAVPALLAPGGTATLVVSWVTEDTEDWAQRPRRWLAGAGCDAWVIGGPTLGPLDHASKWNIALAYEPDSFAEAVDAWVAYLAELGIRAVTEAAIVLRRRAEGEGWFRADRLPYGTPAGAADQIERVFAARDAVEALEADAQMLEARPRLAPAHQFVQTIVGRSGESHLDDLHLRLTSGLQFDARVDPAIAQALTLLDGRQTIKEAFEKAGIPADQGLRIVREMAETGFLQFADENDGGRLSPPSPSP
jgi:precorrin-6B methylase 2